MTSSTLRRIAAPFMAVLLFTALTFAQSVVITDSAKFLGSGTFNIKGHIIDSAAAGSIKTITGTTHLNGSSTQNIGDSAKANASLAFEQLVTDSGSVKLMKVPVTVSKKLTLTSGTLNISTHQLTIDSSTARTTGTLSADSALVLYDGNGAFTQSVIDATYKSLKLANSAPKDLLNPVVADTIAHSGGGLSVNKKLVVNAAGTFATIADATDSLQLKGSIANTIDSIRTTSASGTIDNSSSSALTVNTIAQSSGTIQTGASTLIVNNLKGNAGTIKATSAGDLHFVNPATNSGTITTNGTAAAIRFLASLNNNAGGKIVSGTDSILVTGAATNAGVIQATGSAAVFAGTVNNSDSISITGADTASFADVVTNGGVLDLASTSHSGFTKSIDNTGKLDVGNNAAVTFNQNFLGKGTLKFGSTTTEHFGGSTDSLPIASYGNLHLAGTSNKTAIGSDTLTGDLRLDRSIAMNGHELAITSEASTVSNFDTMEVVGKVKRDHNFIANKYYAFNRDSVGLGVTTATTSPAVNYAINMTPGQDLPGTISSKHVMRRYQFTGTGTTGINLSKLALAYSDSERTLALIAANGESRLGIRSYNGTAWAKVNNPGQPYFRYPDPTTNVVVDSNLASSLTNVTEFGIINNAFQTIAAADWAAGSTWDEGSQPTANDDAEVWNPGVTVSTANAAAASVEVLPSKSLSVAAAGKLTIASLFNLNGSLNVDGTLTLQTNTFRINGPVTNNGTINVGQ